MKSILQLVDNILRKYTPDPFVIAILLTALTYVLAFTSTTTTPVEAITYWGSGFWDLAAFTIYMAMILLGGYVVAMSRPVQMLLLGLIGFIRTPTQAVLFCTAAAIIASWINWGFGLVVGGVVALEVGKRLPNVPFRVLVASSYSGFLVWHAGLSGSIPLTANTADAKITQDAMGGVTVPLNLTTFGQVNITALVSIVVLLLVLNWLMLRFVGEEQDPKGAVPKSVSGTKSDSTTSGGWLENSFVLALLLGGMGVFYLTCIIRADQFNLDLNTVMFIFFMTGLLLHGSPAAFMKSVTEAVPKIAPILIQYPLYAGIMALLVKTGLATQMSEFFVHNSTADTLPLMAFYSAGLVNLFVPSGGGQWAVQAPVVIPAVQELGADLPKTIMAVAWGDAWTNMLQPFWAVPLLTIAGLNIKDIIGLLLVTLLASGVVLSLVFLLV